MILCVYLIAFKLARRCNMAKIKGYHYTKSNHKNGTAKVYTFSKGSDKKYPLWSDIREAFLKAQNQL